jgi:hypothetical protein
MSKQEQIGFHGDLTTTPIRIAQKYGLTTEGITQVNYHSDVIQAQNYAMKRIQEKYPKAKLMFNPKTRTMVICLWTNLDGDLFGFLKFNTNDGKYNDVIATTFKVNNLTTKLF